MPRACCVCTDPRREEIDREVASGRSIPKIAKAFDIPESNLYRHRKDHLGTAAAIATSAPSVAITTIQRLEELDKELHGVLGMAASRGHTGACVAAITQRIRIAIEIGNISGDIAPKSKTVTHVHVDRETASRIIDNFQAHRTFSGGMKNDS